MKKVVVWCEDRPSLVETLETMFEDKADVVEYHMFSSSKEMAEFLHSDQALSIDVLIVDDLMPSCDRWPGDKTDQGLETGVRIAETVGEDFSDAKTYFISYSLHQTKFEFYTKMEAQKRFKRFLKANASPYDVEDKVLEILGV